MAKKSERNLSGIAASEIAQLTDSEQDPWTLYLYAMKSPVTKEKYQKRLGQFFDFLGLSGESTQDKSRIFVKRPMKIQTGHSAP